MSVMLHADRLEKVQELAPAILAGGDKAQELRRLPNDIVDTLVEEGFFRFALPEALGGDDASSMDTVEVLEAIASVDASVAWNVMLGSEINAMAAGGMAPKIAEEVYLGNPKTIMCGGGGPGSKAPRAERTDDGGLRVWAHSTFISGCHNANYVFLAAPVMNGDEPELDEQGNPVAKMWFLPRKEWEIIDTWDVAGLRGSGSNDVKTEGGYVAPEHLGVDLVTMPPQHENPVYRIPVPLRLSYNKVAIALGVARGALGAFADLAQDKVPMLSAATLKHRPIAQFRMGEAMARYRAARAYVLDAMTRVENELRAGAARPGPDTTENARLACVFGANECMAVVDSLHNTAGTSGMRMHSPLERKLRDAHACATHRWVSHPLYENLGKIYLGHEPEPEFVGLT